MPAIDLVATDESKRSSYVMAAVRVRLDEAPAIRADLRKLALPGQRQIHFNDEGKRRARLLDRLTQVCSTRAWISIHDAGRGRSELDRRMACLSSIVQVHGSRGRFNLVLDRDGSVERFDRQRLVELRHVRDGRALGTYGHVEPRDEPLIWIPDAIAWCYCRGGAWRESALEIVDRVVAVRPPMR